MRRVFGLFLVLSGCTGSDGDPVRVAERFHGFRVASDHAGMHGLLTERDRAAMPLDSFPVALPPALVQKVLGWRDARLEPGSLLSSTADTAVVALHVAGRTPDTLRLVATREQRTLWRYQMDRVRWRVALGLAERALLDSLAASMRGNAGPGDPVGVEAASAYLAAAERHPGIARAGDLDAARSMLLGAALVEALGVELRVLESFTGTRFLEGRVRNPTRTHIHLLRLIVRDGAGQEERVEVWGIDPDGTTPVRQLSRLRLGSVDHRVERIQTF